MTYYDRCGNTISLNDWAAKFEDRSYQVVKQDRIDGWFVSTVWLGIDHSFFGGPAQIFETMIFPPDGETGEKHPDLDNWQDRYPTEETAKAGHEQALAMVRAELAVSS